MAIYRYTSTEICCDICNPKRYRDIKIKGFFDGTWSEAVSSGWKRKNHKHICPSCLLTLSEVKYQDNE